MNKKGIFLQTVACSMAVITAAFGIRIYTDFCFDIKKEPEKRRDISANTELLSIQSSSSSDAQSTVSQKNDAVAAGAEETALGKIVAKTVNPESATNKYNHIFLNNKTGQSIDIKSEYKQKCGVKITNDGPQVLVFHTHTTESYMNEEKDYYTESDYSRSTDINKNMAEIGEIFCGVLNNSGINTLHDKTIHDYPSYTGSYAKSAKTVESYLKKYPTIQVVIDIHRDSITAQNGDKTKFVCDIDGKKAAQVMLVMGSQTGRVTGFENWKQNLRLALRYSQAMEVMYPSLARPISLYSKKYNEYLHPGSMLLEIGTDANTFSEAKYAAELSANALAFMLDSMKG